MLRTLEAKQNLFAGVFDGDEDELLARAADITEKLKKQAARAEARRALLDAQPAAPEVGSRSRRSSGRSVRTRPERGAGLRRVHVQGSRPPLRRRPARARGRRPAKRHGRGDRRDRRRQCHAGGGRWLGGMAYLLLFVLASWLCGFAHSLEALIGYRVLQGLVAGPMIPLSQTLLLSSYPRAKAGMAMAMWAMTTLVAPVKIRWSKASFEKAMPTSASPVNTAISLSSK